MLYSIDQPPEGLDGVKLDSLTLQSTDLRFSSEKLNAAYEGKLSVDGDSIAGTRTGRTFFSLIGLVLVKQENRFSKGFQANS